MKYLIKPTKSIVLGYCYCHDCNQCNPKCTHCSVNDCSPRFL